MGFEFSDEHLLTAQCDGDAASNRNRLLALLDGDDWRSAKAVSERFIFRNEWPAACVVRSAFSLGVKRLSPLIHCLSMTLRSVMSICSPPSVTVIPQSCHVPATSNLNCPSAITDGSLRHALLPPVGSARPRGPDRTGHPPLSLRPPVFPLKCFFRLQNRLSAGIIASLGAAPRRSGAVPYLSVEMIPPQ